MYKGIFVLLTIVQLFSCIEGKENAVDGKRVACSYIGLFVEPAKSLYPEDIDASLCTHIVFLAGTMNTELETVSFNPLFQGSPTEGKSYAERLVRLKEANPNLKLILFIGPENMRWVIESSDKRAKIINNMVEFLNTTRFDGLEFTSKSGIEDMEDFSTFFCELKDEFDKYGYSFSYTSALTLESNPPSEAVQRTSKCFSYITLHAADHWVQRLNYTRLVSPINLTKTAVETYVKKGIPANKILISIPTVASIFPLKNLTDTGIGAEIDNSVNETEYGDDHIVFYSMLPERLNETAEGWTVVREEKASSPYAYSKTGLWLSYEDPISAAAKARYVMEKSLGGASIFVLDMDDFTGKTGKTFPIIRAIRDNFQQGV